MKLALIVALVIASVVARPDVSHLAGQGYDYPKPEVRFELPGEEPEPEVAVAEEYLPPPPPPAKTLPKPPPPPPPKKPVSDPIPTFEPIEEACPNGGSGTYCCINGLEHPDCVEETEEPALEYLPPQDDEPVEEEGGYKYPKPDVPFEF